MAKSTWREALEHMERVRRWYVDLPETTADRAALVKQVNETVEPLLTRFRAGELSPELFDAMMAVE